MREGISTSARAGEPGGGCSLVGPAAPSGGQGHHRPTLRADERAGLGDVRLGVRLALEGVADLAVLADHVADAAADPDDGPAHAVRLEDLPAGVAHDRIGE